VRPLVYVSPFRVGLGESRFAYETYHTRILFFERRVRTLTYSVLAYTRILEPSLLSCGVWLSGWVSVTFEYCVETAKDTAIVDVECE